MTAGRFKRMNRFIAIPTMLRPALLVALGALAGHGAIAAEPPANTLQSVDVQPLSGNGLQIVLTTSRPAAAPLSFTIDNPARISLDLADTALALPARRIDVRKSGLDSIVAAEGNGRTRLVLNLDQLQPYQTRVEGNRIILTLGGASGAMAAASAAATPAWRWFLDGAAHHQPHRSAHSDQSASTGQPHPGGFCRRRTRA
jgi:type IV pilus assembly protein PilQ